MMRLRRYLVKVREAMRRWNLSFTEGFRQQSNGIVDC